MSRAEGSGGGEPTPYDNVPDELQKRDQWLLWDSSADTPRQPHWNGDHTISWSNPDDWHTFEETVRLARTRETWGIGYVTAADNGDYPAGKYAVIDIDGGVDDYGNLKEWVPDLDMFTKAATYIEWSPSGTGIHIPVDATKAPEWWSDSQIGEHEGVDLLSNKFCTFTGDKLQESGSAIAQVNPTPWLFDAYTELRGESPRLEGESNDEYDGGEWLEDSHVENALESIDPDISHSEWVRLGYAVHDYDSGSRGRSLFESWSRKGEKYDADAERTIETIWSDASRGSGVTVATLIHKAKEAGWSPPNPKGSAAQNGTTDSDIPTPAAFEVVNGGYAKWHPPRSDDGEGYYEQITNFQIETLSRLTHDDGTREYHLQIHPANGGAYSVTCEPVVFNDLRKFRRQVLDGWTATFDGSQKQLNRLKEFVGTQEAKDRKGTKLLGLHGDEWVTPDGSLTAEGWSDDPETVFTDIDTPLVNAFGLTPSTGGEYDRATVQEILRLLPQTRHPERFLPVVGWFYAAPFRPHIQRWEGEFNILNVLGDTGSGKTTTLETLWRAFGVDEEMPEAKATPFSIMRMLASSNGLPVILDEYKPAEMREYNLNELHSNLRASTRGGVVTKGRSDMGVDTYHLKAPVCISGEQPIEGPAEERRTILTVFKRDVTVGETPEQEAYARLVGGEADGSWYDGYDLTDHAAAYYRWVLQQSPSELREMWEGCRERILELLGEGHTGLDDMVIQGFQTIKFGTTLFRAFASDMGLEPDSTPVTTDNVNRSIQYVAQSGTGAIHTSHLDRLLGIITRAASSGYLVNGDHYKVVNAGKPNAELAIHLPTAFDKVRKYARDHDVRSDDLLSTAGDYKARISDAADDPDSYVVTASQNTPPLNRCVRIRISDASELVDAFEPEAFGVDSAENETQQNDRFNPVSIHEVANDPTGYPTVKGDLTVLDYPDGENAPSIKGTLVNGSSAIDVIAWDRTPELDEYVGETIIIENAGTSEFDDDIQLVMKPGVTAIHPAPEPSQQQIRGDNGGGN